VQTALGTSHIRSVLLVSIGGLLRVAGSFGIGSVEMTVILQKAVGLVTNPRPALEKAR
jgi:hypothetical protein